MGSKATNGRLWFYQSVGMILSPLGKQHTEIFSLPLNARMLLHEL